MRSRYPEQQRICVTAFLIVFWLVVFIWSGAASAAVSRATGGVPVSTRATIQPNSRGDVDNAGVFRIHVRRKNQWEKIADLAYGRFYKTKNLEIPVSHGQKTLAVKVEKHGGGAAHIDSLQLDGKPPAGAGEAGLAKISKADFDVVNAHDRVIEATFDLAPIRGETASLSLTARIEGERISKVPFQYPGRNTFRRMDKQARFYRYRLHSNPGRLTIDGIVGGEELGRPFFSEFLPVGTGHPQGPTYGWVLNDSENLYVAMDFTADNTLDGNADYAKVYVKHGDRLETFTCSMDERQWGTPGFAYTNKVAYQHKTYEFAIPLPKIGIEEGEEPAGDLELAFAAYGTAGPGQVYPAIAYDPNHHQYLVAYIYQDPANGDSYIDGVLLDGTGAQIGSPFPICSHEFFREYVAVAFHPETNRYLVVWSDGRDGNENVFGQLVNADGTLYPDPGDASTNFRISAAPSWQTLPKVAADPDSDRFLVVWSDTRMIGNSQIYGQLVTSDGTLYPDPGDPAANFVICTVDTYQIEPDVGFDSHNHRFLVTWRDDRNAAESQPDIYGRLVATDGTFPAESFAVSRAPDEQSRPSIVFDNNHGRFLIVWEEYRLPDDGIYGQLVESNGAAFPDPADVLTNLPVCISDYTWGPPAVAFDTSTNRFLAVWQDSRTTNWMTYGQLVDADGVLYPVPGDASTNIAISDATENSNYPPDVANNPFCNNFLTVYGSLAVGESEYALKVKSVGACEPDQGFLSFPQNMDDGVTPVSGAAGDTFTFQVYYWGSGAPQNARLLADLGPEATIAAAPGAPLPGMFSRLLSPGDGTSDRSRSISSRTLSASSVLALAVPGLLISFLGTGRRKLLCSFFSGLFVLTVISAGILAGCGGGGGSGGRDPIAGDRAFTLSETDPADTDYLDGKLYSVNITIPESGSYSYRFAFTDHNGSECFGTPTQAKTLTVQ